MTTHVSAYQNVILAFGTAGGLGGFSAYLTYRVKRREVEEAGTKNMIDVAKTLTDTSLALLEPVRRAALDAETRVAALQKQVKDLEAAVDSLTASMAALTATSRAERDQMQAELAQVTADRDRLATVLADRDTELAALRSAA